MAKLTINETPSEEIVKKIEVEVTDSTGRVIRLKKPAVLGQYRLIEAIGDSAKNEVYTAMVMPLLFIASIDDDNISSLRSKLEVEALIQRLDEHGLEAVINGVRENFGGSDPEADKAALKK